MSDEDEPATADAQRPRVCEAAAESEPFFIRAAKPSEAVAGAKAATKPKATRIMIEEVAAETDAVQLERPPVAAAVPTAQTGAPNRPSSTASCSVAAPCLPSGCKRMRLQHALAHMPRSRLHHAICSCLRSKPSAAHATADGNHAACS